MQSLTVPRNRKGRAGPQAKNKKRETDYLLTRARLTPDSLKTIYIIAWRYIIRDYRIIEFESHEYHYIPVLESTLMRFTPLVRGLAPPNNHRLRRTRTAAQGTG